MPTKAMLWQARKNDYRGVGLEEGGEPENAYKKLTENYSTKKAANQLFNWAHREAMFLKHLGADFSHCEWKWAAGAPQELVWGCLDINLLPMQSRHCRYMYLWDGKTWSMTDLASGETER